jgi:hypothetical protein
LPATLDDWHRNGGSHNETGTGGEGFLDVLDARPAATPARLARVPTPAGARTSLFVPEQSRLYLAVPHRGGQRAEIRVYDVRD